jgi:hypothetical protein
MHTGKLLHPHHFEIEIDGESTDLDGLFPDGNRFDRFGIVVTETFGALGGSLLLQAAIANHFEVKPERRDQAMAYPEIYLFHDGGPHGDHNAFDFWPPRKEVFVESGDPAKILAEINARSITRLAVPEAGPGDRERLTTGPSTWAEQSAAHDRLLSCFVYSAEGRVADADLRISSADTAVEQNPEDTFWPIPMIDSIMELGDVPENLPGYSVWADNLRFADQTRSRLHEVSDDVRERLSAERNADREREGGKRVETYRRIDVDGALDIIAGLGAS